MKDYLRTAEGKAQLLRDRQLTHDPPSICPESDPDAEFPLAGDRRRHEDARDIRPRQQQDDANSSQYECRRRKCVSRGRPAESSTGIQTDAENVGEGTRCESRGDAAQLCLGLSDRGSRDQPAKHLNLDGGCAATRHAGVHVAVRRHGEPEITSVRHAQSRLGDTHNDCGGLTDANRARENVGSRVQPPLPEGDADDGAEPDFRPRVQLLRDQFDQSVRDIQMGAVAASMLGVIALAVACLGVVGLVAYSVAQRTNEIGIRLALGAEARHVLLDLSSQYRGTITWGLVLGVIGAAGLAHLHSLVLQFAGFLTLLRLLNRRGPMRTGTGAAVMMAAIACLQPTALARCFGEARLQK
jgi:hypothetical protein